ncbi:MAG: NUDIX domain-containing protein [Clostridia bacterium]|nr:NUDIX domain-containing protein [Clostridia bacterium]
MLKKIITDSDFYDCETEYLSTVNRYAAKAVFINEQGKVALMYMSRINCYKLPGGGIEKGETETEALMRELREETGRGSIIACKIGEVTEHKNRKHYCQHTSAFIAYTNGERYKCSFSQSERRLGFRPCFFDPAEAVEILQYGLDTTEEYGKRFIFCRDLSILKYAVRMKDFPHLM